MFKIIKTGLSDFHKMSLKVMKLFYKKLKQKGILHRKYKNISKKALMHKVGSTLLRFSQISFDTFKTTVDSILQMRAPTKKRYTGKIKLYS